MIILKAKPFSTYANETGQRVNMKDRNKENASAFIYRLCKWRVVIKKKIS